MKIERKGEKGNPEVTIDFDGVAELVDFTNGWKSRLHGAGLEVQLFEDAFKMFTKRSKFTDGNNLSDTVKDLENPVVKMRSALKAADSRVLDDLGVEIAMPRRRRVRGLDDGDEIDIDRYIAREPGMWEEMRKENEDRRIVRLVVNVSAPSVWKQKHFEWRTSAIVAIARALEDLKIPCEIVGVDSSKRCWGGFEGRYRATGTRRTTVVIKRAEQLLDVETVAYVLGSQSFYRTAMFAAFIMAADVLVERGELDHRTEGTIEEIGICSDYTSDNRDEFVMTRSLGCEYDAINEVNRFAAWLANGER